MKGQVGDRITMRAKAKSVTPGSRSGVIEQVLDERQPRYLVRWDDGRSTVIVPLGDTVTIEPAKTKRAAAKAAPKKAAPKKKAKSA